MKSQIVTENDMFAVFLNRVSLPGQSNLIR
ncbi:hypothetical protein C8J30_10530 [Rhodobacter viridis]|uniref:Uncharacterized protein n=1 Tax=Rhodobacter viridis TaxID=1054202 RepID=A0A318U1P3_9RHOB|nr:hypothetical protein C8J30_10530 [Rhodobacter viridis]